MILLLAALAGEIKCQEKTIPQDCNTCRYTLCTDGKEQWIEGLMFCTLKSCPPPKLPYDPNDWIEK